MIDLKFLTDGITVEIKLEDRVCILRDSSGKGKTTLMLLLQKYSIANNAYFKFYNSDREAKENLIDTLRKSEEGSIITLCDEVKYTPDIARAINETKATVICDIKSYVLYPAKYRKCFGRYVIDATDKTLRLRRIGGEDII